MIQIVRHAYSVTLTGAANGVADLPLNPTQLSLTLNDGTSYASVTISADPDMIEAVAARIDGTLLIERVIHYGDGSATAAATVIDAPFEDFDFTEGSKSFSATLKARGTFSNVAPATRTPERFDGVGRSASGEMVFSTGGATDALPGDSIHYDGTDYPIRQARISITPRGITQEFTEQTA